MTAPSPVRRRLVATLGLSLAALVPGACGFHPRGSRIAPDAPGRLFVDADRGLSIEEALRDALSERAFALAANRDEADVVLRITDERRSQRIVSVRSTGRVSEFQLAHAVSVAIARSEPPASPDERAPSDESPSSGPGVERDADDGGAGGENGGDGGFDGDIVARAPALAATPPRADRVEVTREYTYDERQVLGKENEARILRAEMSDELVRQIVLRTVASLARVAETPG